jgi:hypothetical protein
MTSTTLARISAGDRLKALIRYSASTRLLASIDSSTQASKNAA